MSSLNKGRFTTSEIAYIKANVERKTVEEISSDLNRDPISVGSWITKNIGLTNAEKKEVEVHQELKKRPYYKELTKQFSELELEMFEFHFKKMWAQFKDDVFHTEEMQIIDTIKLEVLMNRQLRNQHEISEKVAELDKELLAAQSNNDDNRVLSIERQIAVLRASEETMRRDFKELQSRKSALLKDLKGTRDQRIKAIEDHKQTFPTLITKVMTDPKYRRDMAIYMEKMRLATEKERERLSQLITYEDGLPDRPLLNSESVLKDE